MTLDTYQYLRAVQAIGALGGGLLSLLSLRDAYGDQKWLAGSGINGVRAITASSLVVHEAGRLTMQGVLFAIGVLGLLTDGGAGAFDNLETMLDTLVVAVVFLVSLHSRYVRTAIRHWRTTQSVASRPEHDR